MRSYFPEPVAPGRTLGTWEPTPRDWLDTVVSPSATGIREFLERSLAGFPEEYATSLSKKLRTDWSGHYFELVVGRVLQVLGGSLDAEVAGSNSTNVDFVADFHGQRVSVEAHAKQFDIAMRAEHQEHLPALGVLTRFGRPDWAFMVHEVPSLDVASGETFADLLDHELAKLPASLPADERAGGVLDVGTVVP